MKHLLCLILITLCVDAFAQVGAGGGEKKDIIEQKQIDGRKTLFGTASYYADKFNGRKTYNDEVYDSKKMTAACNVLPMGTWIRVTNLSNNRWVIVKVNDKLHARMTRVVDLSRVAAEKLGYIGKGLTKVKVEVLQKIEIPDKK
ncbi:MAG TPA: septal ring lytic transglycosylase RlpA family protein [Flavisolibacter sp.]